MFMFLWFHNHNSSGTASFGANYGKVVGGGVSQTTMVVNPSNISSFQIRGLYYTNIIPTSSMSLFQMPVSTHQYNAKYLAYTLCIYTISHQSAMQVLKYIICTSV